MTKTDERSGRRDGQGKPQDRNANMSTVGWDRFVTALARVLREQEGEAPVRDPRRRLDR